MSNLSTKFMPNQASPPGDTIFEFLEEKDWTQKQLAERLEYSTKHLNQLISGEVSLTLETAIRLERVLGATVAFWLNREAKYREHTARIEAEKNCSEWVAWLDDLPIKALKEAGVLPNERLNAGNKPKFVELCLRFFSFATPVEFYRQLTNLQVSYRRKQQGSAASGAILAWLRMGEIAAESVDGKNKFNRSKFEKNLEEIRSLTIHSPDVFLPKLQELCHEAGVAFVMVPSIVGAGVSGVARWLNPHKPLIQLSLYGKTNDKFWFTFFHEAAHILLHSKKEVFLDDVTAATENTKEREADAWAASYLIPSQFDDQLSQLKSKTRVETFAQEIGVHPAIVVGRLQFMGVIRYSNLNELKVSVNSTTKRNN